jgi:hypothetical protein
MRLEDAKIPVRVRTDRWIMPFLRFAMRIHLPYRIAGPIIMLGLHAEVISRQPSKENCP